MRLEMFTEVFLCDQQCSPLVGNDDVQRAISHMSMSHQKQRSISPLQVNREGRITQGLILRPLARDRESTVDVGVP